jgi:phosphate transport system substrate-binding protein
MKKICYYSIITVLLFNLIGKSAVKAQNNLEGQISISGAFALYPLVVRWADEFKKINPNVKIDISAGGAGKGITDALGGLVDIGMVSREIYPDETKKGAYSFAVAKDAVVAVINVSNPAKNEILSQGLTKDIGNNIWITEKYKDWSQAIKTKVKAPIHVYTRSDACGAAEIWAKYYGKKQEDIVGSGVYGDPGLAVAVKRDKLGIGFNNIGYAYDFITRKQVPGIVVIPLDLNNNGKIDPDENFYNTIDELVDAIAKGKYPSPPARELYFVTKNKPQNKVLIEFIRWTLTEGQKYVREAGYVNLSTEKLKLEAGKL